MEKIKLLVVDDIPQTRKDITRLLYFEDDMVVVGEAGDGVEALKKISELQPDVVLMDINMPQMDGITATQRVCNTFPHVAVIIISIQGESEYLKKAMVAGARDYLVKPLGSEEMAATIRNAYKHQCLRMPRHTQPAESPGGTGYQPSSPVERAPEHQPLPRQNTSRQQEWDSPYNVLQQLPDEHCYYKDCQFQANQSRRRGYDYMNRLEPLPGPASESLQQNVARGMYHPIDPLIPKETHKPPAPAVQESVEPVVQSTQPDVKPPQIPAPVQPTPPPASSQRVQSSQSEDKPLGQISVVFCGKGGVGKTTIATNLAVALSQLDKKRVALVDYDLQFGDISVLLNLADGKNISDLVQDVTSFTEELMNNYMIRHFTGIDILPAPLFPQDAEYITADHTDQILRHLKKHYDYIVVDTAGTFNEINLQAFDLADQILLVTARDIVTIKNTKTSLNILESLSYRDKIRVILNQSDQDLGVEVPDLEKGLEIPVSHQIAGDEKAVISSINKGVPVVVSHPNSEIARSFKRMSERMTNGRRSSSGEKQGRSIITRMFSL